MASRLQASRFSVGLLARVSAIGALIFVALVFAASHGFYATALVLLIVATLVFADLCNAVLRADRMLSRLADGLAVGEIDRAARSAPGFRGFAQAINRAADVLRAERMVRRREAEQLRSLTDAVPAALFVIESGGEAAAANVAARRLAGDDVSRLSQVAALGADAAQRLLTLSPGGREIVRLANGRLVLASAIAFSVPGEATRRLVCLQDVAGQLDAVELNAWQGLVRVLAHEMLNSLTPILSLAESVQSRPLPQAEMAEAIEVIARRSRGLMNFVDHYRQVAEIPRPVLHTVRMVEFVRGLDRLTAPMLDPARTRYLSHVEPADLEARADPELLEQAVINLLKNAIDATAGVKGAQITLACRSGNGHVRIEVSDNGPGIDPAAADRLFVPFFTTKPGGSGIGLSIARQIALAHHGRLEAANAHPSGAVFTLSLPNSADRNEEWT